MTPDASAAILGPIYLVLEIHCYEPDLNKRSVWLVLPPSRLSDDSADDYQRVGDRIIGPVEPALAESTAANLRKAFERAACEVHFIVTADD